MPAYETDGEQLELIKKWWAANGKWITIAVIIGLACGLGWRFWHQQQATQAERASMLYQQVLFADSQNKSDEVNQLSQEIMKRFPRSEYAAMTQLFAAKSALSQNKNDVASQDLQWVIDHAKNPGIKQIARLRKARVLLAQKQTAAAQQILAKVDDSVFQPEIDEIQGDIYATMGDAAKAHQSYQAAQTGFSAILGEDTLLSMKLSQ